MNGLGLKFERSFQDWREDPGDSFTLQGIF